MLFSAIYGVLRPIVFKTKKLHCVPRKYAKVREANSHFLKPHHFVQCSRAGAQLHQFDSILKLYRIPSNSV